MNQSLYHYCSLSAFEGIIKNKNIRLSNSFKSNDRYELNWIFELMKDMGKLDKRYIVKLQYIYHLGLTTFFRPHMICFSKEADLLSQWRGYANGGQGISIGFNRDYLENSKEFNVNREFMIYDIVYSRKEQEKELKKFLKEFKIEDDIDELITSDMHLGQNIMRVVKIANELFNLGIRFKNPAFKEEKEVRVVHGFPELAAEPDMFEYKFNENNMISYVEIPINNKELFPVIDEIILGPKCQIVPNDLDHFITMKIPQIGIQYRMSSCSLQ